MNRAELMRLARAGAQARLAQLEAEIAAILAQFPGLKRGGTRSDAKASTAAVASRIISPAARRRIAAAQRKRWAQWRASKGKEAGS